jgi:hypothetical protein
VLFSGGTVRLCRIFVKFSGFVVIVVCHVGSINSAPSAQQHAGLRAVPRSHGMVWCGFAESSIKPPVSRPRGPVPADRHSISSPSFAKWARNSHSSRLGVEHVREVARVHRDAVYAAVQKPAVWRMKNRTYAPGNLFGRNDVLLTRTRVLNP